MKLILTIILSMLIGCSASKPISAFIVKHNQDGSLNVRMDEGETVGYYANYDELEEYLEDTK